MDYDFTGEIRVLVEELKSSKEERIERIRQYHAERERVNGDTTE